MEEEIFYLITDIDWDKDNIFNMFFEGGVIDDLPTKVVLKSNVPLDEEEIADWLKDEFGWLVNDYSYEENITIHEV
jgi:hypothetical protein